MPVRLSLLVALALSALMLAAGTAHGAPPLPSFHMLAAEEEPLEVEVEEEDETEEDEGEEEEEESEGETPAPAGEHRKNGRPRQHKKTCRKPAARKRHCKHRDRQDGGFNSRARGGATGQAGRRTPTSE
jgi:hypothetical protein